MLPVETLNQIPATHAAATGKPLNTFVPAALVPDQYSVQTLEHLEMERSRFRGRLSTQSFRDFCTYVEQHQGESDKPAGFVDADFVDASFSTWSKVSPPLVVRKT